MLRTLPASRSIDLPVLALRPHVEYSPVTSAQYSPGSKAAPPMALDVPYRSIPDMFYQRVAATPNGQAFATPNADDTGMVWHTWSQVSERATRIAAGLRSLGVGLEDRVAILAGTSYEWI